MTHAKEAGGRPVRVPSSSAAFPLAAPAWRVPWASTRPCCAPKPSPTTWCSSTRRAPPQSPFGAAELLRSHLRAIGL
jgi:hypothetical protein